MPSVHRASGLIDAIATEGDPRDHRVLFPCGTLARDELRAGLRSRGFTVDELVVYDTILTEPAAEPLLEELHQSPVAALVREQGNRESVEPRLRGLNPWAI